MQLGQNCVPFRSAPGWERSARAPPGGRRDRRAPAGPRNGEEGVGILVPDLEALGTAKSPCQKYTRASQRRPSYASSGAPPAPSPGVASGLLQRRVSESQARWPRLPSGALFGRPLHDPGDQRAAPDLHFREQPSAPPRPGCAGRGPAAGVCARGPDPARGTCNRLQRDNADF